MFTSKKPIKNEETINDNLDLLVRLIKVNIRLKEEIKEDFKACFLEEQDKIGVIESTVDAFDSKELVNLMLRRNKKWNWNNKTKEWDPDNLQINEIEKCLIIENRIFDSMMNKVMMTAIMNVNRPDNHLLNVIAEFDNKIQKAEDKSKSLLELLKKNDEKTEKEKIK